MSPSIPPLEHVHRTIDDADRQLAVAHDVIAGHRGWIGTDACTRLAESERVRVVGLDRFLSSPAATVSVIGEDDHEQAVLMALRVEHLAAEALQLAQRDIDSSRPQDPGHVQPVRRLGGGGRRSGGGDMMGGILGGLVIGSILDGIFD